MRGGCETVLGSQYAFFWGIPLSWFGAAFYLALLGVWLAVSAIASLRMRLVLLDGLLWLTLAGLAFSAGLMYVQFAVLHAFCPLCTASAVTIVVLMMTAVRARRSLVAVPSEGSRGAALTLGLFALIPALIFIAGGLAKAKMPPGGLLMIDLSTAHRIGAANAPVQIVVFSDFQCPFCRQLVPVLQRIRAEFPHEATIAYRHFPLAGHPRALPAAIAAECAAEQGAFWEYHDKLFAEGADLSDAGLLGLAASVGLDQQRFTACLRSAPPRAVVEVNLKEATELGLPGAPSVFINGRRVEGPLTYENLIDRIKELLRASSR
jgi:protein-disulfide isomerase/uncharacterized membrane protein